MSPVDDARRREQHLVSAEELRELVEGGAQDLVVLDVRFVPGRSDGREQYDTGHVPGALFVDLPTDLAGDPDPLEGRRPVPTPAQLQATLRRWGISYDTSVVLYDDRQNLSASRGWWVLRWAGLRDVRVLDGALDAWRRAGGALTTQESTPEPGSVTVTGGALPRTSLADVETRVAGTLAPDSVEPSTIEVLVDARPRDQYLGDAEGLGGEVGGHVPGAISLPSTENLAADGTFQTPEQIRCRAEEAGLLTQDGELVAYCGGGVVATHLLLGLATAGIDGSLFPGSWSQWAQDPARPVATGPTPADDVHVPADS